VGNKLFLQSIFSGQISFFFRAVSNKQLTQRALVQGQKNKKTFAFAKIFQRYLNGV